MSDEENPTNDENQPKEDKDYSYKPENKEEPQEKKKESSSTNMWKPIAIIMTVLFIVAAGAYIFLPPTGMVVGEEDATTNLLTFLENYYPPEVSMNVNSIVQENDMYTISIALSDGETENEMDYYVSLDGQYFYPYVIDLNEPIETPDVTTSIPAEVPKSDIPEVELFIWSYCPYGVQAQGPLAEVASLLEDYANFESLLYYDGHGAYETQQNKIQACIQELEPEKYWDYAAIFVEDIYPNCGATRDIDCDKTESVDLMGSLGIDSDAVMDCVDSDGEDLIAEHSQRASDYGVTGSPTLVINGAIVNVARTAEDFKAAVCSAFNDAPEECAEVLSGEATTANGSC